MEGRSRRLGCGQDIGPGSSSKWEAVKNKFGHRENEDHDEDDFDEDEELWEAVEHGLDATVELGKIDEEEAEEIWEDLTKDGEEEDFDEDRTKKRKVFMEMKSYGNSISISKEGTWNLISKEWRFRARTGAKGVGA